MKRNIYLPFVKKAVLFIIGFFVTVFILQITIIFSVKSINVGEYGVLNKIYKGSINADILISGSSRALKAINPSIIENELNVSCYNIASDGSDLGVQFTKLKWYLENNKPPKILIQDISQFGGDISNSIFEPFKYLPYLSNDTLFKGLERIDPNIWYNKYFYPVNLIYYNFDFYSKLGMELFQTIRNKDIYINGFLPDNSKWSGNIEKYLESNLQVRKYNLTSLNKTYLVDLKNYCLERKIKLVFIIIPNIYVLYKDDINSRKINSFYKSLADSDNVFFLNYANSDISKNVDNFYNFTHLNFSGAQRFTEILACQLSNNLYNK